MPGIEDLVLGAALGVVFQQLCDAIKELRDRTKMFDGVLKDLQKTVTLVTPKIMEIRRMDQKHDNFPKEEIIIFLRQLEKGKELVTTCSQIPRWNLVKKHRYAKRLADLDSSLCRLLSVEFQAEQLLVIKQLLSEVAKINKKLDRMKLQRNMSSIANDPNNTPKPGESANQEQSSNQGTDQHSFEFCFRWKKKNRETGFKLRFWSRDH